MKRIAGLSMLCSLSFLMGCGGGGGKKPVANVTISRTITPRQTLPEEYMKIAVYNTDVLAENNSDQQFDQVKWRELGAEFVRSELERAAEKNNLPIELVDREHMKAAQGEKDMASAGITDSGDVMAASAFTGASAILTSKITIKIDKQSTKEYKNRPGIGIGRVRLGGGSGEETRESRNITVTSQFQLKDAGTNKIIISHTGKPRQHYQGSKKNPFFGSAKSEVDMDPRDQVIADMIAQDLQIFMSKFVPVRLEATCQVESSGNEHCKEGVRLLVVAESDEDFEAALQSLKLAISEDGEDDKAIYAAGVACERLGRYDEALRYYKQALSLEDEEEKYAEARERVEGIMG